MLLTRKKKKTKSHFQWAPLSTKQLQVLSWWHKASPYSKMDGIIADGSVRAGKTVVMSLSFVIWAMESFNHKLFGFCGQTIQAFERNVLDTLWELMKCRGYRLKRVKNIIYVKKGKVVNKFEIFGGKDEGSQRLIQGRTLAGVFFDEVTLMPQSFVNQAMARCSVTGAKFWLNCNPSSPKNFINTDYIQKLKEKRFIRIHFTMHDNLSLDQSTRERYERMFTGVFYKRFILGLWVNAEGIIYLNFANDSERYIIETDSIEASSYQFCNIGVDFGGNKSGTTFNLTGFTRGLKQVHTLEEFRIVGRQTPKKLADEFIKFVKMCKMKGYKINACYMDSAEQTLMAGFEQALNKNRIGIAVHNAIKGAIINRINFFDMLFATDNYKVARHCKVTIDALENSMWNSKEGHEDERLDDGSTNIDTLDALEYSAEPYMENIIANMEHAA
jgi:PBSX family phage terminase large subunit